MKSVTQRIKEITQPKGGYLNPNDFEVTKFDDGIKLFEDENISSALVGMVVDYMTRFLVDLNKKEAFSISLKGASIIGEVANANNLLASIKGNDDISIINACKLVGYDVCFRAGISHYKDVSTINPDDKTIFNIKTMINRSKNFVDIVGPVIKYGITFQGGYTNIVSSGDADFITQDTLWDFKVSKSKPTKNHTLQLLMYYSMGKHSFECDFGNIKKLGIYNPRKNEIYYKKIEEIKYEIIEIVENEIIGYNTENLNINIYEDNNKDKMNKLTVTDIMKKLGCSRHMVMKYYSEYDLPLTKEKNKYVIKEDDFYEWQEDFERRKNVQISDLVIFSIIIVMVFIIILSYYLI